MDQGVIATFKPYYLRQSIQEVFLISNFRRDLNIVYVLLGISPASNCSWPTFRNPVSVPNSKALKMELIQGSETSTNYNLTPGKYPKEHVQHFKT